MVSTKVKTDLGLQGFDADFKVFHELMTKRIRKVLLVLSPYDAFILEEGGSLTSKIVSEYRSLNLSHPPRLIRVSSGKEALLRLKEIEFDLVITLPQFDDMDYFTLGTEIKKINPDLPVILLTHSLKGVCTDICELNQYGIDKLFIWSVDPEFLMSLVKNMEDHLNVEQDTRIAMVRVIILVEDSPHYRSSFLPLLYKEVVRQTQSVLHESLNPEHRMLKMRARPKILVAENYEEAFELYNRFKPYVFGVISDVRFPRKGEMVDDAGIDLLLKMREDASDLPLLLLSSESANKPRAENIPAIFVDKNSVGLNDAIHDFFLTHLGFGDFIFHLPDGTEIDRAGNLQEFEGKLRQLPVPSLEFHAKRNHFSHWVMARSEVALASMLQKNRLAHTHNSDELRQDIVAKVHALRKWRQRGVVAPFSAQGFDPDVMDFVTIGRGSLGGKALGLAFMANQFRNNPELFKKFADIEIRIPQTCVITADGFDSFVEHNRLHYLSNQGDDDMIAARFLEAEMPKWLEKELAAYLAKITVPLTIRSSSLLEDAQFKPFAGLFETYMLPNNHADFSVRLLHLITAVKLVFASTYFVCPRAFCGIVQHSGLDSMAVIIQELVGSQYGDYFYPAISGVAQSYNFYPISYMKREEGIAHIALGMGKTVVEGERSLRFSPRYPKMLPQFSTVDEILENGQRFFYALRVKNYPDNLTFKNSNLERRELVDADHELPVKMLSSTYFPEEHRIRDSFGKGPKVLTFAPILKHNIFPLPKLLSELLDIGRKGTGGALEIEFSVDLHPEPQKSSFSFLQIRPMVAGSERFEVQIMEDDIARAFCFSTQALGHGSSREIADIIYVKPDTFRSDATVKIAAEISRLNAKLLKEQRPYLLIGPGRWGSADPWLGIPVQWHDISGVGAMIELRHEELKVEPSQGTHFFQNITSLGIHYATVNEGSEHFIDWQWIASQNQVTETEYLRHVRLKRPFQLKVDGRESRCVMLKNNTL